MYKMQRFEVSGAALPIYVSLGVKRLIYYLLSGVTGFCSIPIGTLIAGIKEITKKLTILQYNFFTIKAIGPES